MTKELATKPFRPSKADLFVDAYFRNKYNATAAAREVFNIGSKGSKDPDSVARNMGSEYLAKPYVQELVQKRLMETEVSASFVLRRYKELAEQNQDKHIALESTRDLARLNKLQIDSEKGNGPTNAVQVILNPPQP